MLNRHHRRLERSLRGRQIVSEQNGGDLAVSRRRLARLLPRARAALVAQGNAPQLLERGTELLDVSEPYYREGNLDRVEIYPAPLGGWHADLVLRSVPVGISNVLGTALATPAATYEDAEEIALGLLVHILAMDQIHPDRAPGDQAVLLINGHPAYASLAELAERAAIPGYRRLTAAEAIAQLDQVTNIRVSKGNVVNWVLDALIAGVLRYPASVDGAPNAEERSRPH